MLARLAPLLHRSYTIAFSARSGSNELCHLLSRNGLGSPKELFQDLRQMPSSGSDQSIASDIFSKIRSHTINFIFGSKMSHDHRARVDGLLQRTLRWYRTLDDILPGHRWIWLVRRNKIAQAVSLCRAEQSGIWCALEGTKSDCSGRVSFNYHWILSRVMMLCVNDLAWETYFRDSALSPYVVFYEDFFADLPSSLDNLITYLGGLPDQHNLATPDATPTLTVQRDFINYEWEVRFREYLSKVGDPNVISALETSNKTWDNFFFHLGWLENTC